MIKDDGQASKRPVAGGSDFSYRTWDSYCPTALCALGALRRRAAPMFRDGYGPRRGRRTRTAGLRPVSKAGGRLRSPIPQGAEDGIRTRVLPHPTNADAPPLCDLGDTKRPVGFEPTRVCLEGRCRSRLGDGRSKPGQGRRPAARPSDVFSETTLPTTCPADLPGCGFWPRLNHLHDGQCRNRATPDARDDATWPACVPCLPPAFVNHPLAMGPIGNRTRRSAQALVERERPETVTCTNLRAPGLVRSCRLSGPRTPSSTGAVSLLAAAAPWGAVRRCELLSVPCHRRRP